jgi:hypothetical protein
MPRPRNALAVFLHLHQHQQSSTLRSSNSDPQRHRSRQPEIQALHLVLGQTRILHPHHVLPALQPFSVVQSLIHRQNGLPSTKPSTPSKGLNHSIHPPAKTTLLTEALSRLLRQFRYGMYRSRMLKSRIRTCSTKCHSPRSQCLRHSLAISTRSSLTNTNSPCISSMVAKLCLKSRLLTKELAIYILDRITILVAVLATTLMTIGCNNLTLPLLSILLQECSMCSRHPCRNMLKLSMDHLYQLAWHLADQQWHNFAISPLEHNSLIHNQVR